jgi:hypothetical protein
MGATALHKLFDNRKELPPQPFGKRNQPPLERNLETMRFHRLQLLPRTAYDY